MTQVYEVGMRVRVSQTSPSCTKGRVGVVVRIEEVPDHEFGVTVRLDKPMHAGDSPDWVMCACELERE